MVGSGLAGLSAALHLAPTHRVAVLTKGALAEGASGWAQGGIAAVLGAGDSFASHVEDTQVAGAGLCDLEATRFVVENAPRCIAWLQSLGVPFSTEDGQLHLTCEGGHSHRRIVHATDATGAAVQQTLIAQVRRHPNITLLEHHMLVDLALAPLAGAPGLPGTATPACTGLYALDQASGQVRGFSAPHTLLATGGAGRVYLHSTNPATATGDGIAAAWRAGCRVANMEFMQFHPTSLYHPEAGSFLISEAVRGEGGHLLRPDGSRFMPEHDDRAELAPRDVVARTIDFEMKKGGFNCVYLDISHQPKAFLLEHFPNIYERCLALGIDIARQPIPVVPAAHYTCGGVRTDLAGRTDLPGLFALGEAACTGLHGANRLASNSLLECMVFAQAAAKALAGEPPRNEPPALPAWNASAGGEQPSASEAMDALRRCMWNEVGIVRTTQGLRNAAAQIARMQQEAGFEATRERLELRNLLDVAALIVRSAQSRQESRGLHFSRDYPALAETAESTVLVPEV